MHIMEKLPWISKFSAGTKTNLPFTSASPWTSGSTLIFYRDVYKQSHLSHGLKIPKCATSGGGDLSTNLHRWARTVLLLFSASFFPWYPPVPHLCRAWPLSSRVAICWAVGRHWALFSFLFQLQLMDFIYLQWNFQVLTSKHKLPFFWFWNGSTFLAFSTLQSQGQSESFL